MRWLLRAISQSEAGQLPYIKDTETIYDKMAVFFEVWTNCFGALWSGDNVSKLWLDPADYRSVV